MDIAAELRNMLEQIAASVDRLINHHENEDLASAKQTALHIKEALERALNGDESGGEHAPAGTTDVAGAGAPVGESVSSEVGESGAGAGTEPGPIEPPSDGGTPPPQVDTPPPADE